MKKDEKKITPMMTQYLRIKQSYPDVLLFYRMGDFYELFFEDAVIASSILNIALTKRGKLNGKDIAMCGVPHHSSENYLINLIKNGHKVAICEQTETPEDAKKRGYNSVVNREVTRLITPGTITEENLLDNKNHNFLMSIKISKKNTSASWIDISTGDFFITSFLKENIEDFINKINPAEIIISNQDIEIKRNLEKRISATFTILENKHFSLENNKKSEALKNKEKYSSLELDVIESIYNYLEITQKKKVEFFKNPQLEFENNFVKIDNATRKNLEIIKTVQGEKKGALLHTINKTLTPLGSRLLTLRLQNISANLKIIKNRLDKVSFFYKNNDVSDITFNILKNFPDIERSLSRIMLSRANPKDLGIIRDGVKKSFEIRKNIEKKEVFINNFDLKTFHIAEDIHNYLDKSIIQDPPINLKDEIIIPKGFDKTLDETIETRNNSKNIIVLKQKKYSETLKINALKIKYNNFLGYFFEIPIKHKEKLFEQKKVEIISRQNTQNTFRFSTKELIEISEKILNADQKINEIQNNIFKKTIQFIQKNSLTIRIISKFVSEIDLSYSISKISKERNWIKPKIDESNTFIIKKGRHPVVEHFLSVSGSTQFISNDCILNEKNSKIMLITGPNMAGKSTFMRQNALITILAQMGSFVPADYAHIGLVDQIFSRVGASDDLSGGRSTFMVEMSETALILNNATDKSLVIFDEIGRGTSTYDGLSIAWATLEYIHNFNNCRTLFATHYYELTELEKILKKIKNFKINVKEWKDEIIFLHQVSEGISDKSYGIQVAKIAGIPETVVKNSYKNLKKLEQQSNKVKINNINLKNKNENENESFFVKKLKEINIEETTPIEALRILNDLINKTKN